jgi:hypothetical protein
MKAVYSFILIATSAFVTGSSVFAATDVAPSATQSAIVPVAPVTTTSTTTSGILPSLAAPKIGPFTASAGVKSQNTAGRTNELAKGAGRRYKMKDEYYGGLTHTSGWGLSAMAVQAGESFGDPDKDHYASGDPSVTMAHPKLYDDGSLKITGQFRRYFANGLRSVDRHQAQYAYYMFTTYNMAHNVSVFNQLTPRYYHQAYYKKDDAKTYVEDYTTVTKKVNSWFKYGLGQHAQWEKHEDTATGAVVELYPLVDFVINNNIYFEPRVYLPVYKAQEVYDSPKAASLENSQFEIYGQISI